MDNAPNAGEILFGLVGVVIGFLTSFAVFRARFTAIEKDVENLKTDFARELRYLRDESAKEWNRIREDVTRLCTSGSQMDDSYKRRQERREIATLEILGDIARALKISGRFADVIASADDDESLRRGV